MNTPPNWCASAAAVRGRLQARVRAAPCLQPSANGRLVAQVVLTEFRFKVTFFFTHHPQVHYQ